jgi:predicted nucleic acid-binding protein
MRLVFLDTAGLYSVISKEDAHHVRALELLDQFDEDGVSAVTSDWVLAEFLGLAAGKGLRSAAIALAKDLMGGDEERVIAASRAGWVSAFKFYSSRSDKQWSLVDRTSILICRDLGIGAVLTSDHHFMQAGLRALLKKR